MSTTEVGLYTTLGWQTPAVHPPPWQLWPQSWQLVESVLGSTHRWLQSICPVTHWHDPRTQRAPGSHAWLHPPQLRGSVCVLTQAALQLARPPSHAEASGEPSEEESRASLPGAASGTG